MNKKMIDEVKGFDLVLWDEVKEFTDLLREWGFGGSYALTGPLDSPIITRWKVSLSEG